MAKPYFEKLSGLLDSLGLDDDLRGRLYVAHFFNGAALYFDGLICASWSPVGLAFKLPQDEVKALINSGEAAPLRYFPNGYIKRDYALFESPDPLNRDHWRTYVLKAVAATRL